jgi:ubiquinone/menaquinone biosynthesis C-methylase UbiE
VGNETPSVFQTNAMYFETMRDWHGSHNGCALEPRVVEVIERHCVPGARILDAGCGEGSACCWLAARHPRCEFLGVDISPIGVEMASKASPSNARFQVSDLQKMPFEAGSFDFVYSQSVIEHVPDWQASIREMYRVVKKGGEVLIRVGNGGRDEKHLGRALFDVITGRNHTISCKPSFELQPHNYNQHMTNFDFQEIPSDILVHSMQKCGFRMSQVSTCQDMLKEGSTGVKRAILSLVGGLSFWPFTHLGYTSIVVGRK